jgi:hypothetical protein
MPTILDKLKETYSDVDGIDKARNISEALAIVNGTPETAAEPIADNIKETPLDPPDNV